MKNFQGTTSTQIHMNFDKTFLKQVLKRKTKEKQDLVGFNFIYLDF